jgi:hypothetical protein
MADWMKITCPGCGQDKDVAPGQKYMQCDKCGAAHCLIETGACKASGCDGWLQEVENPG